MSNNAVNLPESKPLELRDPFRSQRLVYREIEDTDEDKVIFDEKILKDPISCTYCGVLIQRPQNRRTSNKILSSICQCTLAAYICLGPSEGEHGDDGSIHRAVVAENEKKDKSSTVIGMITLDDGTCDEFHYLHHHRHMELEIFIAAEHQNKGYGTEAVNWGLD